MCTSPHEHLEEGEREGEEEGGRRVRKREGGEKLRQ